MQPFEGLPVNWKHVYVGQSRSLRRRLEQHTQWTEANPDFRMFLQKRSQNLWVWYTTELKGITLNKLEKALIRELDPCFNTQHKASQ